MNRVWNLLIILIILSFISSCRSVSLLTVDLTVPPAEDLPKEIQSLTLINRAVDQRFTDDPKDSIQLRFYESGFNLDTIIYDISASDTLLKALANLLYESGRYDVVIPENRFPMKDLVNAYSDTMSWVEAKDLTKRFSTDAVLSLDYFKTEIDAVFGKIPNRDWTVTTRDYVFLADMRIGYVANFRLYYPENEEFRVSYFIADTLQWQTDHADITELFKSFTKVKDGLTEAGISAALNLNNRIAPVWKSYERAWFSSGDAVLRETSPSVKSGDWESAKQKWEAYAGRNISKSLRSKLEFNIAFASEMQGDLNEALRWGLKSYNTQFRQVTYNYLNTLKERKSLIEKK